MSVWGDYNSTFQIHQGLEAQIKPQLYELSQNSAGTLSSISSASSSSSDSTAVMENCKMNTNDHIINDSEVEAKLLPPNFWADSNVQNNIAARSMSSFTSTPALTERNGSVAEERGVNNEFWFNNNNNNNNNNYSLGHSNSNSNIHDARGFNNNVQSISPNYTAGNTPLLATTPPLSSFGSAANLYTSQQNGAVNNATGLYQQQLHIEQLQQQQQQLQQQQQQLMQNPLFIQQQAQIVSQQLQQLQLQLQLQQQQIESTNKQLSKSKKDSGKLPLTEENLIKLQQTPKSSNSQSSGSTSGNNEKSNINLDLYKTELCTTFVKTGSCPYGNKCQFAHGHHELKVVDRGSKWRSKPCANWSKTGACRYGNRCCFKHGE